MSETKKTNIWDKIDVNFSSSTSAGGTSTGSYWVDASGNYKTAEENKKVSEFTHCRCGIIVKVKDALDGKYCNAICKYNLEVKDEFILGEIEDEEGD